MKHEKAPLPKVIPVASVAEGTCNGRLQFANPGSYARIDPSPIAAGVGFELRLWFQPWLVGWRHAGHVQTIISTLAVTSHTGFAILIDEAEELRFWVGTGSEIESIGTKYKPAHKEWVELVVGLNDNVFDATITPMGDYLENPSTTAVQVNRRLNAAFTVKSGPLLLAAALAENENRKAERPTSFFNGRIDAVQITSITVPSTAIAKWDFTKKLQSDRIYDLSGADFHGILINAPTRGVRGHNWDGAHENWKYAPLGYGAIHFHEDDLDDAGWETDFSLTIPEGARSGVYGVELSSGNVTDTVPFFVRPSRATHTNTGAEVALVLPTLTYLAYANERLYDQSRSSSFPRTYPDFEHECFSKMQRRLDLGLSTYDVHIDNHGVVYSSAKRPILNMRPDYWMHYFNRPLELAADLFMVNLLEQEGIPYDVVPDHDIDAQGLGALSSYTTIITGSHPEYPTANSFTAFRKFADRGGNIMYLGGNGFYWVTGVDNVDRPWRLEVRRGGQGACTYKNPIGECVLSLTGDLGNLWRLRGQPCNKLLGVGFSAEGYLGGSPFRRTEASKAAEYSWIFEGLEGDDLIGEEGFGGPASGNELDKYDVDLGSPRSAVVLATSTGHNDSYTIEPLDLDFPDPNALGSQTKEVRSDMVIFKTSGGGHVFSVGSINWYNSMAWNAYDNDVARLTLNVVQRFAQAKK